MIKNIYSSLNNIFNDTFLNIYTNNKIIKSEISERNLLFYKFKYTQYNKTKQEIVSDINYKNNTSHYISSYYRKEQNISLDTYNNILKKIYDLYLLLVLNNKNKLISIDGTYGNTNIRRKKEKLQTMLFMCYYDVSNCIPIDINFKNNNHNNEVTLAQKWIDKNKKKCKNSIIVADRAYFKFDFFKYLISNNIKFVIRIRNNAKITTLPNCRYISKDFTINKKVYIKKTNKKENIKCINKYTLITNLCKDEYSDQDILDIYNKRWDIEVYFKYIKNNFKLENLKEKKTIDNKKLLICQSIIAIIAKIIKHIYIDINKNIIKNNDTLTTKINDSLLIKGIFENLLNDIINSNLTPTIIKNFINVYCIPIKNKLNRSFERKSLIPFTKWYVKKYHESYKYTKIVEALIDDNINDLNKNLKYKAKTKLLT